LFSSMEKKEGEFVKEKSGSIFTSKRRGKIESVHSRFEEEVKGGKLQRKNARPPLAYIQKEGGRASLFYQKKRRKNVLNNSKRDVPFRRKLALL